jgi:histidinol-phosphatase (PHP family)
MDISEIESYVNAIDTAQEAYPQIKIIQGMECEYYDKYHDFYQDFLLGDWNIRYLILGQHIFRCDDEWVFFSKEPRGVRELKAYTNSLIKGISSGIFTFLAHPDIFGTFYIPWDKETQACSRAILDAAKDMNLPIELNTHGMRKSKVQTPEGPRNQYPVVPFWELVSEYQLPVVINTDAHVPEDIGCNLDDGIDFAKRLSLKLTDLSFLES